MGLYRSLQALLQDWPQLLRDFAAFLLPEQALACGLVSGCMNSGPGGLLGLGPGLGVVPPRRMG